MLIHEDEKELRTIDVAIPGNSRMNCKEKEKRENHQPLRNNYRKIKGDEECRDDIGGNWSRRSSFQGLWKNIKNIGAAVSFEGIQRTALFGTVCIPFESQKALT